MTNEYFKLFNSSPNIFSAACHSGGVGIVRSFRHRIRWVAYLQTIRSIHQQVAYQPICQELCVSSCGTLEYQLALYIITNEKKDSFLVVTSYKKINIKKYF